MPFDGVKRSYGCLRDVKDLLNDWQAADHPQLFKAAHLPDVMTEQEQWLGPALDQGIEGSCTAHGPGCGAHILINKRHTTYDFAMSMNFQYFNARWLEGTIKSDSGAQIRNAIKAMNKYGICSDELWPYDPKTMFNKPTPEAYIDALQYKVLDYYRVSVDQNAIKQVIASGYPLVIGISIYESFESPQTAESGVVPLPQKGEDLMGGHCMCVYGYDQEGAHVRNSWGPTWGKNGSCLIPWNYIANPQFGSDYWAMRLFGSDAEKKAGTA